MDWHCENGLVLDSNEHLVLASLVCYLFTPTGLKLQVYVEQVELLVNLILCTIYISLFSLKLLEVALKQNL